MNCVLFQHKVTDSVNICSSTLMTMVTMVLMTTLVTMKMMTIINDFDNHDDDDVLDKYKYYDDKTSLVTMEMKMVMTIMMKMRSQW